MALEDARKFYEEVKGDQGLQQKIGQLARENPGDMGTMIIKIAGEMGFNFSEAEMKAFFAEQAKKLDVGGELGDAELQSVAGGGKFVWIVSSITSLGMKCAFSAVKRELEGDCALD